VVNGVGLTWLRLPHSFIMTLGTLNIARGLSNLISGGAPIGDVSEPVRYLGAAKIHLGTLANGMSLNLPASLLVVVVLYVLAWFFLNKTATGRHIYAVGGNPHAARVSGINVDRLLVLAFTLCGFTAGMAGLLLAGRTGSGFPNAGLSAELDAIAAVIIGGASFFGGRGTIIGVFCGVFIMGLLRNGLNLMDVSAFWQQIMIGMVIILAVYADVLRRRAAYRT
jgi:ribose transport system permease protein